MRYSASEKAEIINLVENSSLSLRQTLARLDIHKSTFYNWLQRYQDGGVDGLEDRKPSSGTPGIRSLSIAANPLSNWHWINQSCHHENWLSAIPMRRPTLSQSPRFIAC